MAVRFEAKLDVGHGDTITVIAHPGSAKPLVEMLMKGTEEQAAVCVYLDTSTLMTLIDTLHIALRDILTPVEVERE